MINSIVVDDELQSRENLCGVLSNHCPDINLVGQASNVLEAIQLIESLQPELIFLDVEMPGGSGFEVLKHFSEPTFQVIFVTAYNNYAIQAIRFSALDYILKPIDVVKLKSAIKRFHDRRKEWEKRLEIFLSNAQSDLDHKRIALTFVDKIDFVKVKDIIKCTGEGGYTRVSLENGESLLTSKTLADYEEVLHGFGFIRTHKAHLINQKHISSYVRKDGGYFVMSDGSHIPISRRKKEALLTKFSFPWNKAGFKP